jgi:large subunit ribosomal protein L25
VGEKEKLIVVERNVIGKQVKALRNEGKLPLVIYGKDRKPKALVTDAHDFTLLYRRAGHNTVINLEIQKEDDTKEKKNALIHEVVVDPVKGNLLHADLIQIKMNEKITTAIPLSFVGNSLAVADLSGSLITSLDEVEIECFPGDLPHSIEVSIDSLIDFESVIHASDIILPDGVELKTDPETSVAHVEPPRSDEEMEALDEAVSEGEMPESEHGSEEAQEEEKAQE